MRYLAIQVTNLSMQPNLQPGNKVSIRLATRNVDLVVVKISLRNGLIELEVPDSVGELIIPVATLIRTDFTTWATDRIYHVPEESMSSKINPGVFISKDLALPSPFAIEWDNLLEVITDLLRIRDPELPDPTSIAIGADPTSIAIGELILERVLRPVAEQFVGGYNPMQALPQMQEAWRMAVSRIEQGGMMPPFIWEPVKEKLLPVGDHILHKMCEEMPVVQRPPKKFDRKPMWDLGD